MSNITTLQHNFKGKAQPIRTDIEVQIGGRDLYFQTNAESDGIRVCCPLSRKPYPAPMCYPKKGTIYPLLAYYPLGQAAFYENAGMMGAYNPKDGSIIEAETEAFGVGIYIARKDKDSAAQTIVSHDAFLAAMSRRSSPSHS